MPQLAASPRPNPWRALGCVALLISSATVAIGGLSPSPHLTLERHWLAMEPTAGIVGVLAVGAIGLIGRRWRIPVLTVSLGLEAVLVLGHPVCVLIEPAERPTFETVISLQDRAARGEPFYRFGNDWHQCKRYIARALFF